LVLRGIAENMLSHYNDKDDIIGMTEKGDQDMGDIIADITTSFVILAGIFFPSVTGITDFDAALMQLYHFGCSLYLCLRGCIFASCLVYL